MNLDSFDAFLRVKCAAKNVGFENEENFFRENMLTLVEKTWEQWLGPLVPDLPSFQTVIGNLSPEIAKLLSK